MREIDEIATAVKEELFELFLGYKTTDPRRGVNQIGAAIDRVVAAYWSSAYEVEPESDRVYGVDVRHPQKRRYVGLLLRYPETIVREVPR